jgi:hypothetical protein
LDKTAFIGIPCTIVSGNKRHKRGKDHLASNINVPERWVYSIFPELVATLAALACDRGYLPLYIDVKHWIHVSADSRNMDVTPTKD